MQGDRSTMSVELADAPIAAPLEAAWESIRSGLRRDLGARTFDGWLKPAALGTFDPDAGALELLMPSQFMADWVRSHFGDRLALAWRTVLPIVREVRAHPVRHELAWHQQLERAGVGVEGAERGRLQPAVEGAGAKVASKARADRLPCGLQRCRDRRFGKFQGHG